MGATSVVELARTTQTSLPVDQPLQYDTKVLGSDVTGITVVDQEGQGLFIPDNATTLPSISKEVIDFRTERIADIDSNVSVNDLYPQWQENKSDAAVATRLITKAADDLQSAIESNCNSELEILNFLVLAENQLFEAINKSSFNKALESVVSFCAWALRNVDISSKSSPSIPGMCSVLREICEHPFIEMTRATMLIIDLEGMGWSDASDISQAFELGTSAIDHNHDGMFLEQSIR